MLSPKRCHGLGSSSIGLYCHLPPRPPLFCDFFVSIPAWNALFPALPNNHSDSNRCQGYWPFSLLIKVLKPKTWNLLYQKQNTFLNSFSQVQVAFLSCDKDIATASFNKAVNYRRKENLNSLYLVVHHTFPIE